MKHLAPPKLLRVGNLRVVYEHQPGPLTGILLGIRSGSRFDGAHAGLAHYAEHMLFQGTRRRDAETLNDIAAQLGGEHDAVTSFETIELSFRVRNEEIGEAFDLLADQVLESTVPEERFRNERQVILQEIRGYRDGPESFLADQTWARFHAGGLSAPPSGTPVGIRAITTAGLRRYLRERFVAENVVLGVVGGVARGKVEAAVRRTLGRIPRGRPRRARGTRVARTGVVRFRRAGLSQVYLHVLFSVPATAHTLVALALANEIVGTDPDGRLYREVRERHGLSYDLHSELHAGAGWATFEIEAAAERGAEARLRRVIDGVLIEAAEKGFGDDEVARAKRKLAFAHACLAEAKISRAEQHVDSALWGAPTITERWRLLETMSRVEIERAWRRAMRSPRLTGILSGGG